PASSANAARLASADSRSAMCVSNFHGNFTLTPTGAPAIHATIVALPRTSNHARVPPKGRNRFLLRFAAYRVAPMKLSLKRLFARSMTSGPDLAYSTLPSPSPRPAPAAQRRLALVSLAGLMAVLGVAAAAYHFALRTETLKVAVGPANSDDLKVVQTLAQAFNNQRNGQIRLRTLPTDGALASAQALAEGRADLAIIRGDLDVPKNAQA
ncbi:hypothetical protein KXV85_002432, partial [Aspergillus fumigatus]